MFCILFVANAQTAHHSDHEKKWHLIFSCKSSVALSLKKNFRSGSCMPWSAILGLNASFIQSKYGIHSSSFYNPHSPGLK